MALILGFCACASRRAAAPVDSACRELAVAVDSVMPTRQGRAENRSGLTRLWIDGRGVPHVTWSSQWWRFTTMGTMHMELHHAWLAGGRWIIQHDPIPPGRSAPPDSFAHDGARWYVQETEGAWRIWAGPPWRTIQTFAGEVVLTHTQDRDGAWVVTTIDAAAAASASEAPRRRYRFVDGRLAAGPEPDPPPPPAEKPAWTWPVEVTRDAEYDSIAVATRDGHDIGVGVAWRPRGPASERRKPHGEPYRHYRDDRRGRGTLVVWLPSGSGHAPRIVHSVRLRHHLLPHVELGPDGTIHVLLVESYVSGFAPNRYVQLRCRQ